jgi:hypothetical protein
VAASRVGSAGGLGIKKVLLVSWQADVSVFEAEPNRFVVFLGAMQPIIERGQSKDSTLT